MARHWKYSPPLTIKNPFPGARMPHTRADSGGRMKKRTGCGDGNAWLSAGRLTQMISVLNPVLTRNAAGEMTEEWVSCGKIHADIRGRSSRERMQSGAEIAQAEIRIWVRGQSGREITAASRLHVLSGPWRDRILNVVGLPVPDATGGRLEILCRLGGEK